MANKTHPAAASAQDAWMRLHGAKFHKNATAKMSGPTTTPTKGSTPKIAGAAPQPPARKPKVPPLVGATPRTGALPPTPRVTKEVQSVLH